MNKIKTKHYENIITDPINYLLESYFLRKNSKLTDSKEYLHNFDLRIIYIEGIGYKIFSKVKYSMVPDKEFVYSSKNFESTENLSDIFNEILFSQKKNPQEINLDLLDRLVKNNGFVNIKISESAKNKHPKVKIATGLNDGRTQIISENELTQVSNDDLRKSINSGLFYMNSMLGKIKDVSPKQKEAASRMSLNNVRRFSALYSDLQNTVENNLFKTNLTYNYVPEVKGVVACLTDGPNPDERYYYYSNGDVAVNTLSGAFTQTFGQSGNVEVIDSALRENRALANDYSLKFGINFTNAKAGFPLGEITLASAEENAKIAKVFNWSDVEKLDERIVNETSEMSTDILRISKAISPNPSSSSFYDFSIK